MEKVQVQINQMEEGKRIGGKGISKIDNTGIKQYFVGLMDGYGSIQVNQWNGVRLQYRMTIKMPGTEANLKMLERVAEVVGGKAEETGGRATWIVNHQGEIGEIIKIFEEYPLITTKMHLQLKFMKRCLGGVTMEEYYKEKGERYKEQEQIQRERNEQKYKEPEYFNRWLGGYTEGEGEFKIGWGNVKYGIGQKGDRYIIEAIREKFGIVAEVRKRGEKYEIETVWGEEIGRIVEYYDKWELIGEKGESYKKFREERERIVKGGKGGEKGVV